MLVTQAGRSYQLQPNAARLIDIALNTPVVSTPISPELSKFLELVKETKPVTFTEAAKKIAEIKNQRDADIDLYGPADPNDANGKLIAAYEKLIESITKTISVVSEISYFKDIEKEVKQFKALLDEYPELLKHPELWQQAIKKN